MKGKDIFEDLLRRYPVLQNQGKHIWNAYQMMIESFEHNGKLLVAGNGGSAADAEHIVGELMKGFVKPRKLEKSMLLKLEEAGADAGKKLGEMMQETLPAIALTGHPGLSTAFANDRDPYVVFAQQVYGYGDTNDIFLGISTSGNSQNILYACIAAKAKGMKVIALTGKDGGKLKALADVSVLVPAEEAYQIQELHLPVYHCWCLMLEEYFFQS